MCDWADVDESASLWGGAVHRQECRCYRMQKSVDHLKEVPTKTNSQQNTEGDLKVAPTFLVSLPLPVLR